MHAHGGLNGLWRRVRGVLAPAPAGEEERFLHGYGAEADYGYGFGVAGALWRGLNGRDLEIAGVQEDVAAELRGQVLVAGLDDAAVRGLLARLRGQPPAPSAGPIYREGFFTLVTLPAAPMALDERDNDEPALTWTEVLGLASEADVVIYVWSASRPWHEADGRWYARLRATGRPLILVAGEGLPVGDAYLPPDPSLRQKGETDSPFPMREDGQGVKRNVREGDREARHDAEEGAQARWWPPGERPVQVRLGPGVDAGEAATDVLALIARVLERCSRLAVPLAQEIPGLRPMVAGRIIRQATLTAALLGAEPIPLLDLPLQVAVHWRMALQLAAISGHGTPDYRSREMIGTVAWNLGLRRLIQQALKLVPVLGWAASAGLSGLATWLLGNGLWRYFQGEDRLPLRMHTWRAAVGARWQAVRGRWPIRLAPLAPLRRHISFGQALRLPALQAMKGRRSHQDGESR